MVDFKKGFTKNKYGLSFATVFSLSFTVYALSYFCRVNLSIAAPYFIESLKWNKLLFGILASSFFWSYAIGQLVNGIIGDRFNPRYFVGFGLLASGITNLLITFVDNFFVILILWVLNGFFQAMLWGPVVRTVSLVTKKEMVSKVGTALATSIVIGYMGAYFLIGSIVVISWKLAFVIPGIILIIMSVIWVLTIKINVNNMNLEKLNNNEENKKIETIKNNDNILVFIVKNKLLLLMLAAIMQGVIKESITTWGPIFLTESQKIEYTVSLKLMSVVPVVNFASLLSAGYINAKFRNESVKTVGLLFLVASISSLILANLLGLNIIITLVLFATMSGSILALNSILTAIIPLNYSEFGKVSSVAGILNFSGYVGAGIAGPIIGILANGSQWKNVVYIWGICSFFGFMLMVISFILKNKSVKKSVT